MRPLGKVQTAVLNALKWHKGWHAGPTCGWVWDTRQGTIKILESLVRRELVVKVKQQSGFDLYKVKKR